LKETGISTGNPDGTFHPSAPIEREAMAAFLSRAHVPPPGPRPPCVTAPFADVGPLVPFCAEIQWLQALHIVTGYADGTFHPYDPVSRQAMAAFLRRFTLLPS